MKAIETDFQMELVGQVTFKICKVWRIKIISQYCNLKDAKFKTKISTKFEN
jgi:hypothetical protein